MNIGDVIATAAEFDGLPAGSLVIDTRASVASPWQRYGNGKWDDLGTDGTAPLLSASEMESRHQGRLTVVYLPGRPRPERVVKAEAWAEGFEAGHACTGATLTALCAGRKPNPYRIEAGDAL